jgi:4a-hydroxytetrahydrobiopterin dehydratase
MATELLSDADINDALSDLPDWEQTGDTITRTIKAPSFLEGIELVRQVAEAAEAADHHPDIDIRWRRITFALSTHSAGGLTGRDMVLAHQIDRLAAS